MSDTTLLASHIARLAESPIAPWRDLPPWELTSRSAEIVRTLLGTALDAGFRLTDDVAVHRTALVEPGAILKGPLIVGARCFIAAGAYLRGGCWLASDCILGPGAELKSSFVFEGTKLAHFNFVGDSVLGSGVNLEAGSIVCNYRNERAAKEILVRERDRLVRTGVDKFGALIGDGSRVGAHAVIAPGALLAPGSIVARTALVDQEVDAA